MSGHSKWANIKNRKGAQDKKRSETFTKVAKDILTAIRTGGGNTNRQVNQLLRTAIEKAREVNMPKENIERLLANFELRKANLVNYILEGYGPFGVPLIIEVESDNKNRILSEIKLILKNYDGGLGESNSVMYQFKRVGEVEFENLNEELILQLIDIGAKDFDEKVALVDLERLIEFKDKSEKMGLKVVRAETVLKSNNPVILTGEEQSETLADLMNELEENEDVVKVFAGYKC
jgi:YebC/PmpR family DNA-binding regulatory protein